MSSSSRKMTEALLHITSEEDSLGKSRFGRNLNYSLEESGGKFGYRREKESID